VEVDSAPRIKAHFRSVHDCMPKHVHHTANRYFIVQGDENKWDLMAKKVVELQLSPYWPNGWLEFPEMKWI